MNETKKKERERWNKEVMRNTKVKKLIRKQFLFQSQRLLFCLGC